MKLLNLTLNLLIITIYFFYVHCEVFTFEIQDDYSLTGDEFGQCEPQCNEEDKEECDDYDYDENSGYNDTNTDIDIGVTYTTETPRLEDCETIDFNNSEYSILNFN